MPFKAAIVGVVLAATAATAAAAPVADATLDFDRTFDGPVLSRGIHYTATYLTNGQLHHVEVWRDGDSRVRRRTDDRLETLAVRPDGSDEWSMTILDRTRKIRTDVDRTSLMRIGRFTDWFAQMHVLSRPRGPYRLVASPAGMNGVSPAGPCRWYVLTDGKRASTICWSSPARIPLIIADGGVVQWQVTRMSVGSLPPDAFVLDDRGYVRNDANADIRAD